MRLRQRRNTVDIYRRHHEAYSGFTGDGWSPRPRVPLTPRLANVTMKRMEEKGPSLLLPLLLLLLNRRSKILAWKIGTASLFSLSVSLPLSLSLPPLALSRSLSHARSKRETTVRFPAPHNNKVATDYSGSHFKSKTNR